MQNQEVKKLLEKYLSGECDEQEKAFLETWYLNFTPDGLSDLTQQQLDEIFASTPPPAKSATKYRKMTVWPRIAAAAVIIIMFSVGGYFILRKSSNNNFVNKTNDILPGTNKALLTLSNGRQILLNNTTTGTIANQGNSLINKRSGGSLAYSLNNQPGSGLIYNTLSIPAGGQYTLILSDGSKIIINSASTITYPVAFTGNERKVTFTGEAYFEIAHDRTKPFRVVSSGQTVEVLGTHFNINAYADEGQIKTTLLQGAVKVSSGSKFKIIEPGQQAVLHQNQLMVQNADIEEAVAWKNGYFRFNNENIESIMRKLARWYNIDVKYSGNISTEGYYGKISRFKNISQVLNLLEKTNGAHFKIEGKEVIVLQ